MNLRLRLFLFGLLLAVGAPHVSGQPSTATTPVALHRDEKLPFTFVVYGDTRFTKVSHTKAANPVARQTLVQAIAAAHPEFVCIDGDITFNGYDPNDWRVWDEETAAWRQEGIPVFPILGNHDLHGNHKVALTNYFARFPEIKESRYYSVRAANTLLLMLDSSLDELAGPQGEWLKQQLETVPADVDFIVVLLHHPPYTSSSDEEKYGGGHSARMHEEMLAKMLEQRQSKMHARIVVFAGHVHNYERHEHGGITYFVSGGGGAHAYPIERAPGDPFQSKQINYHYLLVTVDGSRMSITMNRLDPSGAKPEWTQPDHATIDVVGSAAATSLVF